MIVLECLKWRKCYSAQAQKHCALQGLWPWNGRVVIFVAWDSRSKKLGKREWYLHRCQAWFVIKWKWNVIIFFTNLYYFDVFFCIIAKIFTRNWNLLLFFSEISHCCIRTRTKFYLIHLSHLIPSIRQTLIMKTRCRYTVCFIWKLFVYN